MMTEIDRDALERAIELCRAESAAERRRIDAKLANGERWQDIAGNCACNCQQDALNLMPWQLPPMYYANHLDSVLREPFGDPSGRREAGEVLRRLLDANLSKFEPDPIGALAEAERAKNQPAK